MKKWLKWYYGKASIRTKLVISYLVLVLFPIIVLGMYSYHISKTSLIEQMQQTMEGNLSSIAYNMQKNIQRENDNIKYLSYNKRFRTQLEIGSKNVSALAKELNESVEPTFWYFLSSDNHLKAIEIFSPYVEQAVGDFLYPLEEAKWQKVRIQGYKTQWIHEEDTIYATRTLLDANTSSEPIGIMKLEVFPDNFIDAIYQSVFLNNGIILTDENGKIIGNRELEDKRLEQTIQTMVEKNEIDKFQETGEYMLAVSEPLSNGWKIYYYIDKQEISSQINQILATTGLAVGICLAVVTIFISVISKFLSSRILQLKSCAEEVSRGNFDVQTDDEFTDEIGIVAQSFGKMCKKINGMMQEMYRLGMEKRAEELKALQAMINPHFLYNCLSSIKWKAIRAEQSEIADITGLLAKFYRTALNEGKQITVVENEIANIKAYLEIQMRTHEYSFDVEYLLAEKGLQLEMPNFLLQPIVENAICHGVEYCEAGTRGCIRIEYSCQDNFLIFKIYNNGVELTEEEVQKILMTQGKGYGIYNIQERIRMYYDEACGIFGSVSEEGMVCFTVKIRDKIEK